MYILYEFLQTTFFNIAIQISLNYISAGLTSVLTYSMPLFLSLMAHYFIPGEKLTARKTGGILIGILGLFLAMDIQFGGNIWAPILALSSAVTLALSSLIFKKKLQSCDTIQFTTWPVTMEPYGCSIPIIFRNFGLCISFCHMVSYSF